MRASPQKNTNPHSMTVHSIKNFPSNTGFITKQGQPILGSGWAERRRGWKAQGSLFTRHGGHASKCRDETCVYVNPTEKNSLMQSFVVVM